MGSTRELVRTWVAHVPFLQGGPADSARAIWSVESWEWRSWALNRAVVGFFWRQLVGFQSIQFRYNRKAPLCTRTPLFQVAVAMTMIHANKLARDGVLKKTRNKSGKELGWRDVYM